MANAARNVAHANRPARRGSGRTLRFGQWCGWSIHARAAVLVMLPLSVALALPLAPARADEAEEQERIQEVSAVYSSPVVLTATATADESLIPMDPVPIARGDTWVRLRDYWWMEWRMEQYTGALTAQALVDLSQTPVMVNAASTNWQSSPLFGGLVPNMTYVFYGRVASTGDDALHTATIHTWGVPDAPTEADLTIGDGWIRVNTKQGDGLNSPQYEWSVDGGEWQVSPVFDGLTPGTHTLRQRVKDGTYASEPLTFVIGARTPASPGTPGVSDNGSQGTLDDGSQSGGPSSNGAGYTSGTATVPTYTGQASTTSTTSVAKPTPQTGDATDLAPVVAAGVVGLVVGLVAAFLRGRSRKEEHDAEA